MAIQFTQLRYPNDDAISFDINNIWSNNLIEGKSVIQLGIYALPGTTFLINQDNKVRGEGLIINGTGIFQINTKEKPITSLRLNKNSYNNATTNNHFIIIDLIYEGGINDG